MTIAVFDYATWLLRYPEFASVSQPLADAYFVEAGLYLSNADDSVVPADAVTYQPRLALLGMLVAHIAALASVSAQPGGASQPGRVASATEGSVSVSFDVGAVPGTAGWFAQTSYGYNYWQATAQYRTFQYRPYPGRPGIGPTQSTLGLFPWRQ